MRRPKILYTTADASPQSGAFRSLLTMSSEVDTLGYQAVVVLPEEYLNSTRASEVDHGQLHGLPIPRLQRGRSIAQYVDDVVQSAHSISGLVGIIRRERVALVHVNEILDVYAAIAARIAGVPCVWHVRADLSAAPSVLAWLFPRIVVGLSTEIIVVSSSTYEHVFLRRGVRTRKASVIYDPGPNPSTFHQGVNGTAVRKEMGLGADVPLVALIAKLEEPKGHEVLIRAAPRVLASFPNARFLIVGGDLDGAHHRRYADRLRRLPSDLGVDDAVAFAGYRSDIAEIMSAADIVAHCSTYPDPFPGVVLQGMAVGKAVIASDLGGPREQIEQGVSGVLVRAGDPLALAEAICSLLRDSGRRATLGGAAARRVRSVFSQEVFYRQLLLLYERLLTPKGAAAHELVEGRTGSAKAGPH